MNFANDLPMAKVDQRTASQIPLMRPFAVEDAKTPGSFQKLQETHMS